MQSGYAAPSIAERMEATKGRSSGFDYLRIVLAVTVVATHSLRYSYGEGSDSIFWDSPLRPFYRLILPMFFALSGFLVAGSLERSKTVEGFLGLRVIRIYPALAVEVVLSAFILGPLVTAYPLHQYFTDPQFRAYLLNATGDVHFFLPGVFAHNPRPYMVNGQLWTVPFELLCYISIAGLAVLGVLKRRYLSLLGVTALTLGFVAAQFYKYGGAFPESKAALPGFFLVVSFLSGIVFYLYRREVRWSWRLAALSAVAAIVLLGVVPFGEYLSPLPAAYLTVFLGLTDFKRLAFMRYADLSYGVYLYGSVVQQTVAYLFPWSHQWYLNCAIAIPSAFLIAAFSWRFVEKPALGLRVNIQRYEAWRTGAAGRKAAAHAALAPRPEPPEESPAPIQHAEPAALAPAMRDAGPA